ncbi:ribonuclease E/G, partial [Candidatus Omnitrophota bacterium]
FPKPIFTKAAPSLVHQEYDLVLRVIRDNFTVQANKLLVDSKEEFKRIMRFLSIFAPNLRPRVQFYHAEVPLFEKKGAEDKIAKIYDRQVFLSSGGYLMIEPTESLVAIDVNSGRFTGKKDPEENACLVNVQAADEIARQIRLRDLGGIVIIDFIDMKLPKNKKRVLDVLHAALKRDHAKTDISAVSGLGLVEMSRQRARKSLESVVYQPCHYCQGKGLVKSAATMAIFVLRRLKKILRLKQTQAIFVFVHPQVASFLVNENRQSIVNLENLHKVKISVKQNANLHIEELKIEIA